MKGVEIIAEIGINHGGDFNHCSKLITAASSSGANSVKLQIVDPKMSYMKNTISYNTFKDSSLSYDELNDLMQLSREKNIDLFSTPGDFKSLEVMLKLGMNKIKISSGLMTNYPLIEESIKTKLPLIISTGMAEENEIDELVSFLEQKNAQDISLLKCTSVYPSPTEILNLNGIRYLKKKYPNYSIGYSDHCLNPLACMSAVAIGAEVIEKHFTLNKNLEGGDHFLSAEPDEFKSLVDQIRVIEGMLGEEKIEICQEEKDQKFFRYRCLVSTKDIAIGQEFTKENIGLLRPEKGKIGAPAKYYYHLLGQKATVAIEKNQPISLNLIKNE